jgi:hypothetical protein
LSSAEPIKAMRWAPKFSIFDKSKRLKEIAENEVFLKTTFFVKAFRKNGFGRTTRKTLKWIFKDSQGRKRAYYKVLVDSRLCGKQLLTHSDMDFPYLAS